MILFLPDWAEVLYQTVYTVREVKRRTGSAHVITLRMELRKPRGVGVCTNGGIRSGAHRESIKTWTGWLFSPSLITTDSEALARGVVWTYGIQDHLGGAPWQPKSFKCTLCVWLHPPATFRFFCHENHTPPDGPPEAEIKCVKLSPGEFQKHPCQPATFKQHTFLRCWAVLELIHEGKGILRRTT